MSRHIEREKASLPVDVRRSKTSLLKLPISNRTGTSVEDGARKSNNWLDQWLCVGCAANWAPEVEFSPFRALSCRQMTVRMLSVCLKEGVRLFGGPLNRGFTVLNVLETENVLIKAL